MSITLVCGFGRCGSSMMMQMLHAGGLPTVGEYPDFEDNHAMPGMGLLTPDWLSSIHGRALKLLDPQRFSLPPGDYTAIWMERDYNEQAKSFAKFARLMLGVSIPRSALRKVVASYRSDHPHAMRALRSSGARVMSVAFEDALSPSRRRDVASRVAQFIGRDLNLSAMCDAVQGRSTLAASDMTMEMRLIAKAQESPSDERDGCGARSAEPQINPPGKST